MTAKSFMPVLNFTVSSRFVLCAAALAVLSACTIGGNRAPVVERSNGATEAKVLEPVGPGFYRVKKGDTLYRIALEHGQGYRDIAGWNNLANPNQIEVDQVLRIAPPDAKTSGVTTAAVKTATAEGRPLDDKKPGTGKDAAKDAGKDTAKTAASTAKEPEKVTVGPEGSIALSWPNRGAVIERFDETKNKGIDIAGKAGDAVLAAGEGKVVYAGNSLRGYGNLVIVKHDATYLTAYAHNRTLLIKENDNVKKGQKIAEMGDTDSNRVKLHFEVRKNGKPVDPIRYLPTL